MSANVTTAERLAALNVLRVANDLAALKTWKRSRADLETAIAELTPADAIAVLPTDLADITGALPVDPPAIDPDTSIDTVAEPVIVPEPTPTPDAPATPEPAPSIDPNNLRACLMIYDIPSSHSDYRNPSGILRRIGFRANLSCWVIPEANIPYALIAHMREHANANVDVVRFDAAEGPRLVRMAIDAIHREVNDQVTRAAASIAGADTRHLNVPDELAGNVSEREAVLRRYETRTTRILESLNELLEDVETAIKCFGQSPERLNLNGARAAYNAYQTGIEARVNAFAAATHALSQIGTADANAMADAAKNDAAPAFAMADMLRDNGHDAAADALTAAFDLNGTNDETFSIADAGTDDANAA